MFHEEVISGKTGRYLGKGRRPSSGVTSSKDQGDGDSDPQGSPGDGVVHTSERSLWCAGDLEYLYSHTCQSLVKDCPQSLKMFPGHPSLDTSGPMNIRQEIDGLLCRYLQPASCLHFKIEPQKQGKQPDLVSCGHLKIAVMAETGRGYTLSE